MMKNAFLMLLLSATVGFVACEPSIKIDRSQLEPPSGMLPQPSPSTSLTPTLETTPVPGQDDPALPTASSTPTPIVTAMPPTPQPSWDPTPTEQPTPTPTVTLEPTLLPTPEPTLEPTLLPTPAPTLEPTFSPTPEPTWMPTALPSLPSFPPVTPTPAAQCDVTPYEQAFGLGLGDRVLFEGVVYQCIREGCGTPGASPAWDLAHMYWQRDLQCSPQPPFVTQHPAKLALYLAHWQNPKQLDWSKVDQLHLAYGEPQSEGGLKLNRPEQLQTWITQAQQQGVPVYLVVGQWSSPFVASDQVWNDMARSSKARANFVQSLLLFANQHNIAGVNLQWQFPYKEEEVERFRRLVRELGPSLAAAGLELHLAVTPKRAEELVITKSLMEDIDGLHLQAYEANDMSFEQARASLQDWLDRKGYSQQKLFVTLPLFAVATTELGLAYMDMNALVQAGASLEADSAEFFGQHYRYNGTQTLALKARLGRFNGQGVSLWHGGQDYFGVRLDAVYQSLRGAVMQTP